MGEANRVLKFGPQARVNHGPQQIQIQIDREKDKPEACACGSVFFEPAIQVYKIAAVHPQNPTGRELVTQAAVLVCKKCGEIMK